MTRMLHEKKQTGCVGAVKFFILFFGFVVVVRAIVIPSWEAWDDRNNLRRNAYQLARIAAFINHDRRINAHEELQAIFVKSRLHLQTALNPPSTAEWNKIECREVPFLQQEGELYRVDYILFIAEARTAMLSDGRLLYRLSSFDWDKIARSHPMSDPWK